MLRRVVATRYVLPLREGGSLPGLMEASDDGLYVVKYRGAGQGLKTLVAEVLVGQIARAIGVAVPELVLVDVPTPIARYEADEEVQDLLDASIGLNLGMDFLPGAFGYDGTVRPSREEAARMLWLDAYTTNVDRTWANPNLVVWHRRVYAIDHGAAFYTHHSWPARTPDAQRFAATAFDASRHVLADIADSEGDAAGASGGDAVRLMADLHAEVTGLLSEEVRHGIVEEIPTEWLEPAAGLPDADAVRDTYRRHLRARLEHPEAWLPGVTS